MTAPMLGITYARNPDAADLDGMFARIGGAEGDAAEALAKANEALADSGGAQAAAYDIRNFSVTPIVQYANWSNRGTDISPIVRAAIVAAQATGIGGKIIIPDGRYYCGSEILIDGDRGIHIEGQGIAATTLYFEPLAPGTLFKFDRASTGIDNLSGTQVSCSMRRMTIRGAPEGSPVSRRAKSAIEFVCASEPTFEDILVIDWWTDLANIADGPSKGVRARGKEMARLIRLTLVCDRGISIEANPKERDGGAGPIDCDGFHIQDLYCVLVYAQGALQTAAAAVWIAPDLVVRSFKMDGENIVGGGSYGIYWDDPAGGAVHIDSVEFTVMGFRTEQQNIASGASIYISRRGFGTMHGLNLMDVALGFASRGIVIEGCWSTDINKAKYYRYSAQDTSPMALTIAASCRMTAVRGFYIPVIGGGTSLVALTGQVVSDKSDEAQTYSQLPNYVLYNG